jgi:hypothetical protein
MSRVFTKKQAAETRRAEEKRGTIRSEETTKNKEPYLQF